jgi:PhzF family phenazine biosynthesis protein
VNAAKPTRQRAFCQVNVFSPDDVGGNPLGVVLDGTGLETGRMQAYTDWANLSETTFLLPPSRAGADYRVRIFCPGRELPFAGHPTLGSCHAWLEAGGIARGGVIVQECEAGLVRIRHSGERLAFAAPPLVRFGPLEPEELARMLRGLGVDPARVLAHSWCSNGPQWRALLLDSHEAVLAAAPDRAALQGLDVGLVGPRPAGDDAHFEVRAFFTGPGGGVAEDPVTGSLNAALGQWLIGAGLAPASYVASQGSALGRHGRVHVERDAQGTVWVGGDCQTLVEGTVLL